MKTWKVRTVKVSLNGQAAEALRITCPFSECKKTAYVSPDWLEPKMSDGTVFKTKPCSYCFGTARVPGHE